jgi:hypothetical protein
MKNSLMILLLAFTAYAVPKDSMITYIFLGHSNMQTGFQCGCAQHCCDQISDRVWLYGPEKGFYKGNTSACVSCFLNELALRYPKYNFAAANYSRSGYSLGYFKKGDFAYEQMCSELPVIKDKSTVGGVAIMFGFIDGVDSSLSANFDDNLLKLVCKIRDLTENYKLPCIVGQYEINNQRLPEQRRYRRYEKIVTDQIQQLGLKDSYIKITPVSPVPPEYYCDDHHFTCQGYKIWTEDAVSLIQLYHLDEEFSK